MITAAVACIPVSNASDPPRHIRDRETVEPHDSQQPPHLGRGQRDGHQHDRDRPPPPQHQRRPRDDPQSHPQRRRNPGLGCERHALSPALHRGRHRKDDVQRRTPATPPPPRSADDPALPRLGHTAQRTTGGQGFFGPRPGSDHSATEPDRPAPQRDPAGPCEENASSLLELMNKPSFSHSWRTYDGGFRHGASETRTEGPRAGAETSGQDVRRDRDGAGVAKSSVSLWVRDLPRPRRSTEHARMMAEADGSRSDANGIWPGSR